MPAMIILAAIGLLGAGYVLAWDRVERIWKKTGGPQSVAALEKKIADGDKSAGTWMAYGEALGKAKEYGRGAAAYKEVIKLEPMRKDAKFQCAVCLANAGRSDELHEFLKDLVVNEPKLAMQVLDRPDVQKYVGEERFAGLKEEARNQAMD
jgi:hypothetical protein